jgi:hypothetical protein
VLEKQIPQPVRSPRIVYLTHTSPSAGPRATGFPSVRCQPRTCAPLARHLGAAGHASACRGPDPSALLAPAPCAPTAHTPLPPPSMHPCVAGPCPLRADGKAPARHRESQIFTTGEAGVRHHWDPFPPPPVCPALAFHSRRVRATSSSIQGRALEPDHFVPQSCRQPRSSGHGGLSAPRLQPFCLTPIVSSWPCSTHQFRWR